MGRLWHTRAYQRRRARAAFACLALVLLAGLGISPTLADNLAPDAEAMRLAIERLQSGPHPDFSREEASALSAFYAARNFAPVWDTPKGDNKLRTGLAHAASHGLNPADYHPNERAAGDRSAAIKNPAVAAHAELSATASLYRLLRDLRFGKVDRRALEPDWSFDTRDDTAAIVALLKSATEGADITAAIDRAAPGHWFYGALRQKLAHYRGLTAALPTVGPGPLIKPGMEDPRSPALRARLAAFGDYTGGEPTAPQAYDSALVEAVIRFQKRHGLDPDGVVGPKTLGALNVSAATRINQIRINLERARWVLHALEPDVIVVNIAGFQLFVIEGAQTVWSSRIIVGRTYRKTPVFKANMQYLVLNPTWTVPPTILREDKLPAIQADPSYLSANNMVVLDAQGRETDPARIDWRNAGKQFPYQLVQKPGPGNALGRIKFMFPNSHSVYLHDTPSRELFSQSERAFSSGCIRIERPASLALRLLAAQGWDNDRLERELATGRTQTVVLKRQMPVLIMYWTVHPQADGSLHFFHDIYGRDGPILRALDAPRAPRT